jgi:hypothetical protein
MVIHRRFGYFFAIIRASKTTPSCCEDDFLTGYYPSEQDNVKLLRRR